MKIAIIGNNPVAIEAAYFYHKLGASVGLFYDREQDPFWRYRHVFNKYPESWKSFLKSPNQSEIELENLYNSWWNDQLAELEKEQDVKKLPVERIHKRYLEPYEQVDGRSRLVDLFRVVFTQDPQEVLKAQKERNPEVFDTISPEVLNSLKHQMESYEDFDLVVDASYFNSPKKWIGTGDYALGEKTLKDHAHMHSGLHYGFEAIEAAANFKTDGFKEVAIIGSGEMAAMALIEMADQILEKKLRVFVITYEAQPFEQVLSQNTKLASSLEEVLSYIEKSLASEIEAFLEKRDEWDKLDDFVKVKIPKPIEPIPDLVYFAGHNVMAVDRLVDQSRYFITCEVPEFREVKAQVENAKVPLKTIGVEQIFVLNGKMHDTDKLRGLHLNRSIEQARGPIHEESGFYTLTKSEQQVHDQMEEITQNMMKFFHKTQD